NSLEACARVVDRYYQRYLGRGADPVGRAGWAQALSSGFSREQFALGILTSAEFAARNPGDAGFIVGLYQTSLGRQPSAFEVNNWALALARGTPRLAVANGIVRSAEAYGREVATLYQNYLGRGIDQTGLSGWVGLLTIGAAQLPSIEIGLLASAEYQ